MLQPGQTLGSFEILETLGAGAMGQVYRARGPEDELVALKLISSELAGDAGARQRFASENAILKDLRQPRIVAARTGLEEAGERLYYAMEFVEGTDLAALLEAEGPLSPERALGAVADVLEALGYAHARDVLHRDVKASNVMVEASGRMKLGDFGLARALDGTRVTRAGSVLGTPAYMAPELAEGGEASVATEVYAVGVLLHELLAGAPPFRGESALAVLHQHIHSPPPPLEGVRAEVQAIVARALAKRPSERFASATEMRDAVLLARGSLPGGDSSAPSDGAAAAHAELAAAETRELGVVGPGARASSPDTDSDPQGPAAFRTTIHEASSTGAESETSKPAASEIAASETAAPESASGASQAEHAGLGTWIPIGLAILFGAGLWIRGFGPPPPPSPLPSPGASPSPTGTLRPTPTAPTSADPTPTVPSSPEPSPASTQPAQPTQPSPSPESAPNPATEPSPSPSPAPARPRVEVRLHDGTSFRAELGQIDLERGELVTHSEGQVRRDALSNVESYQRVD